MYTLKPLQMLSNFGQKAVLLWSHPAGTPDKTIYRKVFY